MDVVWATVFAIISSDPGLIVSGGLGRGWAGRSWLKEAPDTAGAPVLEANVQEAIKKSRLKVRRDLIRMHKRGKLERSHEWSFQGGLHLEFGVTRPGRTHQVKIWAYSISLAPEFRALKGLILAEVTGAQPAASDLDHLVAAVR